MELRMGVDFLKSKQKKFAKGWDLERINALQRRLLGSDTGILTDVVARVVGTTSLHEGDQVLVRADGDYLSVVVDLTPAAVSLEATPAIVNAVRESGGYARGTIQVAQANLGLVKVRLQ
jgi:hypothetical protein